MTKKIKVIRLIWVIVWASLILGLLVYNLTDLASEKYNNIMYNIAHLIITQFPRYLSFFVILHGGYLLFKTELTKLCRILLICSVIISLLNVVAFVFLKIFSRKLFDFILVNYKSIFAAVYLVAFIGLLAYLKGIHSTNSQLKITKKKRVIQQICVFVLLLIIVTSFVINSNEINEAIKNANGGDDIFGTSLHKPINFMIVFPYFLSLFVLLHGVYVVFYPTMSKSCRIVYITSISISVLHFIFCVLLIITGNVKLLPSGDDLSETVLFITYYVVPFLSLLIDIVGTIIYSVQSLKKNNLNV